LAAIGVAVSSRMHAGFRRCSAVKLLSVLVLCASSTMSRGRCSASQLARLQRGWPTKPASTPVVSCAASAAVTTASGKRVQAGQCCPLARAYLKCGSKLSEKLYTLRCPASSMRKLWMVATTTTAWRPQSGGAIWATSSSVHTASPRHRHRSAPRGRVAAGLQGLERWLRMVSLGTSHTATGASCLATRRASRGTACAASTVLPPPVGMRRHTQGTCAPKASGCRGGPRARQRPAPGLWCGLRGRTRPASRAVCW
jgi:hypothetical protein